MFLNQISTSSNQFNITQIILKFTRDLCSNAAEIPGKFENDYNDDGYLTEIFGLV